MYPTKRVSIGNDTVLYLDSRSEPGRVRGGVHDEEQQSGAGNVVVPVAVPHHGNAGGARAGLAAGVATGPERIPDIAASIPCDAHEENRKKIEK